MRIPKSLLLLASVMVAAAALVTGISSALTAGATGASTTYYGCLHNGTLKKVGVMSPTCTAKGSTVISWDSIGPRGPQGAQGPQGPQGAQGAQGAQGSSLPLLCPNCDLSYADLHGDDLTGAYLRGATIGSPYTSSNFSGVVFANADLTGANFGGDLTKANFQNSNLSSANFYGADLTGATNMTSANTTGDTWIHTTCPDGANSDFYGPSCVGHL